MRVRTFKTHAITPADTDLLAILDRYVPDVPAVEEGTVLAITSKIVAICQGRVVKLEEVEQAEGRSHADVKGELIRQEADYYLPPGESKYRVWLTIKEGRLIPSAGIDESNGAGYAILWPADAQAVANRVRAYLAARFGRRRVGVLITDSTTAPLRLGVTGIGIAHSGFQAINDLVGTPDIFGRPLQVTRVNVRDALAAAAVLVMGEGREQTPLALLEELPFVAFQDRDPTPDELAALQIAPDDDLYAPLLKSVAWQRGGQGAS
ncbi:MAG TPA: coenzyme F420-0:L-glutamate ligase [Caldilineaceae bacterium]|nr:coenzyme F420-0:L-glutamate ligase [Caldilineaceae bacterium]